jgi:hypothetical protein
VRDDVLARLLALNAERYAEEQERGLSKTTSRRSKRRDNGSEAKSTKVAIREMENKPISDNHQIGLSLF